MAQVTSGKDMTVIVLTNDEASALANLLDYSSSDPDPAGHMGEWSSELDELTSAMLGEKMAFAYEEPVTNWDKPEPSWKDEPTSDYRFGRG